MTRARTETRLLVEIDANRLDRDIYHLAARIDQFCELASRGKPKMNRELIDAARSVDAARSAVRKFMCERDRVVTVG